jgi:hypothetical protein
VQRASAIAGGASSSPPRPPRMGTKRQRDHEAIDSRTVDHGATDNGTLELGEQVKGTLHNVTMGFRELGQRSNGMLSCLWWSAGCAFSSDTRKAVAGHRKRWQDTETVHKPKPIPAEGPTEWMRTPIAENLASQRPRVPSGSVRYK